MKNWKSAGCLALEAAAAGAVTYLLTVAPGRAREEQLSPFRGRYIAHRGLYNEEDKPENSLAAFRAAAECGYGAELDVRLSLDGAVVISHDNNLARMTGRSVNVDGLNLARLQELSLLGTPERIPLLTEALDILGPAGVPVIVELKACPRWKELCRKTLAILDARDLTVCVESFDPRIVAWFRRSAPDLLRGILTSQPEDLEKDSGKVGSFLSSRMLYNWLCRPQFVAHHVGRRSASVRLTQALGAFRITWTAHDRSEEKGSDAVIFERFLPPVHYR